MTKNYGTTVDAPAPLGFLGASKQCSSAARARKSSRMAWLNDSLIAECINLQRTVLIVTVIFGLALGAAGSLYAQEFLQQGGRPQKRPDPPAREALQKATATSPAQPVQAAPAFSGSQAFGEWLLKCDSPGRCSIAQRVAQIPSNAVLIWFEIGRDMSNPRDLLVTIMTPLGFRIANPLSIYGDASEVLRVAINQCVASGCIYTTAASADVIAHIARQSVLRARYIDPQGRALDLSLSTNGLSEALMTWSRINNQK